MLHYVFSNLRNNVITHCIETMLGVVKILMADSGVDGSVKRESRANTPTETAPAAMHPSTYTRFPVFNVPQS